MVTIVELFEDVVFVADILLVESAGSVVVNSGAFLVKLEDPSVILCPFSVEPEVEIVKSFTLLVELESPIVVSCSVAGSLKDILVILCNVIYSLDCAFNPLVTW